MKNKLPFILLCLVLSFCVKRSDAQVEVTYGPELAGTISGVVADDVVEYAGFDVQAGATSHIQFGRFFALRPSVFYKTGSMFAPEDSEYKMSLSRVGVNLPALFSFHFNSGHKLYVGAGPSLMYNLSGKFSEYGEKSDIKFGNTEEDDLKPVDFGLNFKMGFQFAGGLSLGYFFNYSFLNQSPGSYETVRTTDAVGISIGWMFGGNRDY